MIIHGALNLITDWAVDQVSRNNMIRGSYQIDPQPKRRLPRLNSNHSLPYEPTPIKLTKNEAVNIRLIQLMKAEKHHVILFEFDRNTCMARIWRPASYVTRRNLPNNIAEWNVRHGWIRPISGPRLKVEKAMNLDDVLDYLDRINNT